MAISPALALVGAPFVQVAVSHTFAPVVVSVWVTPAAIRPEPEVTKHKAIRTLAGLRRLL